MTSSRRDWDYTKSFTFWSEGNTPRPEDLSYRITVHQRGDDGQPYLTIDQTNWCKDNCQHAWAWWFDAEHAYVGFADQRESMLFALTNL